MSRFDDYDSDAPAIPGYTCPTVDAAIRETRSVKDAVEASMEELESYLEELRSNNAELREGLEHWQGACQEACLELEAATEDYEAKIAELRAEVAELKEQLQPSLPLPAPKIVQQPIGELV